MNIYEKEYNRLSVYLKYIECSLSWRVTKYFRNLYDSIRYVIPRKDEFLFNNTAQNDILFKIYLLEKIIREKLSSRSWRYTYFLRLIGERVFNYKNKQYIPFKWWNFTSYKNNNTVRASNNYSLDDIKNIINKERIEILPADIRLYILMNKNPDLFKK
jgi:hypothetical protein